MVGIITAAMLFMPVTNSLENFFDIRHQLGPNGVKYVKGRQFDRIFQIVSGYG